MSWSRIPVILPLVALGVVSAHADTAVRIVTYNVHHGEGTDGALDLERIAGVIIKERPDIVCLQEIDQGCGRTHRWDLPAEFSRLLGMNVVFGPNLDFDGGKYGNATLTRFPIVASENVLLPNVEGGEQRGVLIVTVHIDEQEVDVLNTHFDLTPAARKEQAATVIDRVRDVPTILAGDLNEPTEAPAVSSLLNVFQDSYQPMDGKHEGTLHGSGARRIDFILASKAVRVLSSRVVTEGDAKVASDHLPYVAEISIGPRPESASDKGVRDNRDERIEQALTH